MVALPNWITGIGSFEGIQYLTTELHVQAELFRCVLLQGFFPSIRVQDLIARKVQMLALLLRRTKSRSICLPKLERLILSSFDGLNGVLQAVSALQVPLRRSSSSDV